MNYLDVHSHFLSRDSVSEMNGTIKEIPGSKLFSIEAYGKKIMPMPLGFFDVEARLREMGAIGIDSQVISPTHHLFLYDEKAETASRSASIQNNGIAEACKKAGSSFLGNGTLPLQDRKMALSELERIHSKMEMNGIEIGTNIAGKNLDDDSLHPVYEKAQELEMPIFVHPNDFLGGERLSKFYMGIVVGTVAETTVAITSLLLGGVLKKFPRLKFIFCHGGGAMPFQIGRIKHATEVREEVRGREPFNDENLKQIFFDTVLFDGNSM